MKVVKLEMLTMLQKIIVITLLSLLSIQTKADPIQIESLRKIQAIVTFSLIQVRGVYIPMQAVFGDVFIGTSTEGKNFFGIDYQQAMASLGGSFPENLQMLFSYVAANILEFFNAVGFASTEGTVFENYVLTDEGEIIYTTKSDLKLMLFELPAGYALPSE